MRFQAERQKDGTYTLYDVPIFGEVAEGIRGNERDYDANWQQQAVDEDKRRRQDENYKAPLHLKHHGFDTVRRAGYIRLTRVGSVLYEGKPMSTVFADFFAIPAEVFKELEGGDWPYRSVEILKPNGKPTINSVALLDTEEPFFRLPVTDAGSIDTGKFLSGVDAATARTWVRGHGRHDDKNLCVAYHRSDTGAAALFSFSGAQFMDDNDKDKKESMSAVLARLKAAEEERDEVKAKLAAYMDDDDDKADKKKAMDDDDKDKDKKPFNEGEDDKDKDDDKKPAEPMKSKADGDLAEKYTAQGARLSVLEAKQAEREKADEVEARYNAAVASLKGWHLTDAALGRIREAAEEGQKTVDIYVAAHKAGYARTPVDIDKLTADDGGDDPEVAQFVAAEPDRADEARGYAQTYDELEAKGWFRNPGSETKEQYIKRELAAQTPAGAR